MNLIYYQRKLRLSKYDPYDSDIITAESELSSCQQKRMKTTFSTSFPMYSKSDAFKEVQVMAIYTIAKKSTENDQFDAFGTHVTELRNLQQKLILAKRKNGKGFS